MSPPEPMLSTTAPRWPEGGDWVLQPKWDGFRLLIQVDNHGQCRAWSRRGANLTERVGLLLPVFERAAPGSVFDGELVAVVGTNEAPVQDFRMVCRAVLNDDLKAAEHLRFVAFDLLQLAGEDLRSRPWTRRDQLLAEALPGCSVVRRIDSMTANQATHAAIVDLGFEGSVLKRRHSVYRGGRTRGWVKLKARYTADAVLLRVRQDQEGHWHAICDVDGRAVSAIAGPGAAERVGEIVRLVYSRVDADGGLREARLEAPG